MKTFFLYLILKTLKSILLVQVDKGDDATGKMYISIIYIINPYLFAAILLRKHQGFDLDFFRNFKKIETNVEF